MVYIASPLKADTPEEVQHNIRIAELICRRVILEFASTPFAPHIYFTRFLNDADPAERQRGMDAGLAVMRLCWGLWVFGDRITAGMKKEIQKADRLGIGITYWDYEVNEDGTDVKIKVNEERRRSK
jgi:hypothetical protein